jgi:hypothetical protein
MRRPPIMLRVQASENTSELLFFHQEPARV